MTPLQRFEALDAPISALLKGLPLPAPNTAPQQARQAFFADLARYWSEQDGNGVSRQRRLAELRHTQLRAEIDLRVDDQTLDDALAARLRACLSLPLPWQRQTLPANNRPQLYRPLLDITRPHWRGYLPACVVIVEGGPEGQMLTHAQRTGSVVMCSLSHGIEAFDNLQALHIELCERLDDPCKVSHCCGFSRACAIRPARTTPSACVMNG